MCSLEGDEGKAKRITPSHVGVPLQPGNWAALLLMTGSHHFDIRSHFDHRISKKILWWQELELQRELHISLHLLSIVPDGEAED
ncbi:hypothetical protein GOP47_0002912 [Adiantum capillus-veneris]|uniref:Uncharacterized protein n=1 Tax=Adiantum capillus-veneris TaxID=13818 RepID=A0A9D4ZPL3_ADICA|nr:hypothetical protein GOP47_0002912 [Adiantum capillus-veneris]